MQSRISAGAGFMEWAKGCDRPLWKRGYGQSGDRPSRARHLVHCRAQGGADLVLNWASVPIKNGAIGVCPHFHPHFQL